MSLSLIILAALFLAYANGANDNFKGVATLFGSGTSGYRQALRWTTLTTAVGALLAIYFAHGLIGKFSGKELLPDGLLRQPAFAIALAFAAASTVIIATQLGLPISTTHALIGSLVGVGLAAAPQQLNLTHLGSGYFLPLVLSPPLALLLTCMLYPLLRRGLQRWQSAAQHCLCVESAPVVYVQSSGASVSHAASQALALPVLVSGTVTECKLHGATSLIRLRSAKLLDWGHYLSAGAVCLARGLNDTPKIAALLLLGVAIDKSVAIIGVASLMALGGWLSARRVAVTMSKRITSMTHDQGLAANLVTSAIVVGASKFGLPVSTTHVSCGALFGIGALSGSANLRVITSVVGAWVVTLPIATLLGAVFYLTVSNLVQ